MVYESYFERCFESVSVEMVLFCDQETMSILPIQKSLCYFNPPLDIATLPLIGKKPNRWM